MQILSEVEKTDTNEKYSCLKRTMLTGKKNCVNFNTDTGKLNVIVQRYWNNFYLKDIELALKLTQHQSLLAKRVFTLSYIDMFSSGALYWMKQLFIKK